MRISRRYALSLALILAGSLCVAIPFIVEALEYPWGSSNENELPDPSPPEMEYISYADYIKTESKAGSPSQNPEPPETPWPPGYPGSTEPAEPLNSAGGPSVLPDYDEPLEEPLEEAVPAGAEPPPAGGGKTPKPPSYVLLGAVKIPGINISENLFEGTDRQLKHGIGHLEGTPMPGEKGNAVLAAHRVSSSGKHPFRHLDKLQDGDVIAVKLGEETFRYEVFDVFIIAEDELWVLQPSAGEPYLLTLVTCDPVVSVGRRENRLIVRARPVA